MNDVFGVLLYMVYLTIPFVETFCSQSDEKESAEEVFERDCVRNRVDSVTPGFDVWYLSCSQYLVKL